MLLWAPEVAIGAVNFQPVTSERQAVTAEVASSSLVVPAISYQALTPVDRFPRGSEKVNSRVSTQISRPLELQRVIASTRLKGRSLRVYVPDGFSSQFPAISETTVLCAARFAAVTAWV